METSLKKWGGICLMAGVILIAAGNALMRLELMPESTMLILGLIWGHGLLAIGLVGLAVAVMNDGNRGQVMSALGLTLVANILLTAIGGIALTFQMSGVGGTMEVFMQGSQTLVIHNMIAHFGMTIGLLVLLYAALGNPVFSKAGIYLFMLGVVGIGAGFFISETVFGASFIPLLIGGLWTGWDLLASTAERVPASAGAPI